MRTASRIALALVIIGAINWGLIGLFGFDLVASLFGGQDALLSRIVYALVGLSGLVSIGLLFMTDEDMEFGRDVDRETYTSLNYNTEFGEETDYTVLREPSDEGPVDRNKQKHRNNQKNANK